MDLQLYYGSIALGMVEDAFCSDKTWYGQFRPISEDHADPTERRVHEFIAFCEQWHGRLRKGLDPDASEFDAYRDLLQSGEWHTVGEDGIKCTIECPVFADDEITWRMNHE